MKLTDGELRVYPTLPAPNVFLHHQAVFEIRPSDLFDCWPIPQFPFKCLVVVSLKQVGVSLDETVTEDDIDDLLEIFGSNESIVSRDCVLVSHMVSPLPILSVSLLYDGVNEQVLEEID